MGAPLERWELGKQASPGCARDALHLRNRQEESKEDSQVSLTEVTESVMPVTETRRVSILNKFPHIKIRALKGTITDITRAREEVQYTLVSGTL